MITMISLRIIIIFLILGKKITRKIILKNIENKLRKVIYYMIKLNMR